MPRTKAQAARRGSPMITPQQLMSSAVAAARKHREDNEARERESQNHAMVVFNPNNHRPGKEPMVETDHSMAGSESEPDLPEEPPTKTHTKSVSDVDKGSVDEAYGRRYSVNRQSVQAKDKAQPKFFRLTSKAKPYSAIFLTKKARTKFEEFQARTFFDQRVLPRNESRFSEIREILNEAGLLHTVSDIRPYSPSVVREFMANLVSRETRNDMCLVYVRGQVFEFSARLINELFQIPSDTTGYALQRVDLDKAALALSDGRKKCFKGLKSKHLTITNNILHSIICSNWIPSTNKTKMASERVRLMYLIRAKKKINFGELIYRKVLEHAESSDKVHKRIYYPNLIYQILEFQRLLCPRPQDLPMSARPSLFAYDPKAGRGFAGANDTDSSTLQGDIQRIAATVSTMVQEVLLKIQGGEYDAISSSDEEGEAAAEPGDESDGSVEF